MKITKAALFVFAITLFTSNLFAQGAYVNINAGYGFSMSPQVILYDYEATSIDDNSTGDHSFTSTYENVTGSLGKGFNFGGAFGYMFNKNMGAEIGVSYLLGGKTEEKYKSTQKTIETEGTITTNTTNRTTSLSSRMLRFNPSIVITSGFEGIDPYAKFGFIIGTGSVILDSEIDQNDTKSTWKYNGGVALGMTGAIGANFTVNDKMAFFGEINMVNMSYAPTKGELTESTANDTDLLPGSSVSQKEIEFIDSQSYSSDYIPPPDSEPSKRLKTKYPFGSVGISIGLRMNI